MIGYDLSNFRKGKAFIHFDGVINGKFDYGPRICINTKGEKLFELPDRDMLVNEFEDEDVAFVIDKGDLWGLIDRYNNIIEDFIYDDAQLISDNEDNAGEFIILLKDNLKAIYSTKKKGFITDFKYNFIGFFQEGRFMVSINNVDGFIDTEGNEITPIMYHDCHETFQEGVCAVYKDNKAGMINLDGQVVIPFEYDRLNFCCEGLIYARKGENEYFIDKHNNIVLTFSEDMHVHGCSRFKDGFVCAWTKDQGNVYIDKTGKILEIKI